MREDGAPDASAPDRPSIGHLSIPGVLAILAALAASLGIGLGPGSRLTYHEAFVAQSAREMLADGDWAAPHVDGRPWLEKPPLLIWAVAGLGRLNRAVDESAARVPAALAASGLALVVAGLAARRYGPNLGLLAGLIQATTSWAVIRGRLAEPDIVLAFLVAAAMAALDRLRQGMDAQKPWKLAALRGLFLTLVGLTSLVKGIGFGAALIGAATLVTLLWDLDWRLARPFLNRRSAILVGAISLAWPAWILWRFPKAWSLWTLHITDRLAESPEHFAGAQPWWFYGPAVLGLILPWTPLGLLGLATCLRRACHRAGRRGSDRLLLAWALAPLALLSLATVKNSHYALSALSPWSIWAAMGLCRVGEHLERKGHCLKRLRPRLGLAFALLGLTWGVGLGVLGPHFDRRGQEWAFYETAGRAASPELPLTLVYDDWDRQPYPTPFGPFPHDLAVRLFYLNRPATWIPSPTALSSSKPQTLIARPRDLPTLERLGRLDTLAQGPTLRASKSKVDDRTFHLYRLTPRARPPVDTAVLPTRLR